MLACRSDIDRREKVLFLSERGADFLAKDNVSFANSFCSLKELSSLFLFRGEERLCFTPFITLFLTKLQICLLPHLRVLYPTNAQYLRRI